MSHSNVANQYSFKDFLLTDRRNRITLIISGTLAVIQFIIFKHYYPFPAFIDFESDSFIKAADSATGINTYLIGYSSFLRLVNTISSSDTFLTAIQYLLLQANSLFFLFTLFYLFKPRLVTQYILIGFIVINPLPLYLSNLVVPDAIFAALSIFWFTLLIWILCQPDNRILVYHALAMVVLFTISYKAWLFPFVSAIVFALSNLPILKKIISWGAGAIACILFIIGTGFQFKQLTGHWQPAPYLGWLAANNALLGYREVPPTQYKPVPPKLHGIDTTTRKFFKRYKMLLLAPTNPYAANFYIRDNDAPLIKYKEKINKKNKDSSTNNLLKEWATMAPLYFKYGHTIIQQYPQKFLSEYIWWNIRKYFAPPSDFMETYPNGKELTPTAIKWFSYEKDQKGEGLKKNSLLNPYLIFSGIVSLLLLFSILYYFLLRGKQYDRRFSTVIIITSITLLTYSISIILTITPSLKTMTFYILLATTFVAIITDWMYQLTIRSKATVVLNTLQQSTSPV